MWTTTLLLAASVVGVDTGWRPHEQGGMEYIIQIEPELLSALRDGEALTSEIPADITGVRRYRIMVGSQKLPRIAPPKPEPVAVEPANVAPAFDEQTDDAPSPFLHPPTAQPVNAQPATAETELMPPPELHVAETRPAETEVTPPSRLRTPNLVPTPAQVAAAAAANRDPASNPPLAEQPLPTRQPPPAMGDRYGMPATNYDLYSNPLADNPRTAPPANNPPVTNSPAENDLFATPPRYSSTATSPINEVAPPQIVATVPPTDARQTTFKQPGSEPGTANATSPSESGTDWVGWTITLFLLTASLAINFYLAWMWLDTRRRYRNLVYERRAMA